MQNAVYKSWILAVVSKHCLYPWQTLSIKVAFHLCHQETLKMEKTMLKEDLDTTLLDIFTFAEKFLILLGQ